MIWCPIGQVEQAVKDFEYHSGAGLLDYVPATYGQYVQFRENHRASRSVGVWYSRTVEWNNWFKGLWSRADEDKE